jgi:hypothetical protein
MRIVSPVAAAADVPEGAAFSAVSCSSDSFFSALHAARSAAEQRAAIPAIVRKVFLSFIDSSC